MGDGTRAEVMAAVEGSAPLRELLSRGSSGSFIAAESVQVVLRALLEHDFTIPADTMPVHRSMSLRRSPSAEPAASRVEATEGNDGAEVWFRIGETDVEFQIQFAPRPLGLLGDLYESLLSGGTSSQEGGG